MDNKKRSQSRARSSEYGFSSASFVLFIFWMICAGIGGYFHGSIESSRKNINKCTEVIESIDQTIIQNDPAKSVPCESISEHHPMLLWHQKQAFFEDESPSFHVIKSVDLKRSKWNSIVSIEPKVFHSMFLTQYPGDIIIEEPVVILAQKHLTSIEDVSSQCKLLDIAIIPDIPGTCVAISETTTDIASLHMLHASVGKDDKFVSVHNPIEGRTLPSDESYKLSRSFLQEYFERSGGVVEAFKQSYPYNGAPKRKKSAKPISVEPMFPRNVIFVGCLILNEDEYKLFQNSLLSLQRAAVGERNIIVVTPNHNVKLLLIKKSQLRNVIYVPNAAYLAKGNINLKHHRYFLQAWMAFVSAEFGVSVLWQSPSTVWMSNPLKVLSLAPANTELIWGYKGRSDPRASPFYISMDFLWIEGSDNAIAFMHEVLLRVDLMIEWDSVDAVASYRLSEDNARYGTSSIILSPSDVFHTIHVQHDAKKIFDIAKSATPPLAVVVPSEGLNTTDAIKILQDAKLWLL